MARHRHPIPKKIKEAAKLKFGGRCGYCPNPKSPGCGAAWFRAKLKTYKELNDGHTVDSDELEFAANLYKTKPEIFKLIYEDAQ